MSYEPVGPSARAASRARRVVVLEADTPHRAATEGLLKRQDYWTITTDDPQAAVRVTAVDAADLVLVDLGLEALAAIPQGQRRRGDTTFPGVSAAGKGGYAVLRPLQADSSCARFPLVTLRPGARADVQSPPCRFAFVDRVPLSSKAEELLAGLETIWRQVVEPARARADGAEGGAAVGRSRGFEPASGRPEPFASTPLPLRTALVVDPDLAFRAFVCDSLGSHGFSVHEAASGDEGLRLAFARRPFLILTELDLPDESGLAFCHRVREHRFLQKTPLVVLSEKDDCDSRYLALKAGADDYLAKPASEREMLVRLELVLRRSVEIERPGVAALGLRGALEFVGTSAVLQLGHLGRLSGVLTASRGTRSVRIGFRQGEIVSAVSPEQQGPEAVYDFIGWDRGLFEFHAGALGDGPFFEADFNALVLEGCRRLDMRRRAGHAAGSDPY